MLRSFILLFFLSVNVVHAFSKKGNVKNCKDEAKGPCYEFAGRARVHQNKYLRIWKKGTNRLYLVSRQTDSAYSDLKHLSMATEMHALFDVCFLKPEVPSGISEICVESVKDAKTTHMPE